MKQLVSIFLSAIIVATTWGCGSGNKSKQIKEYKYAEEKSAVTDSIQPKFGPWIKEGATCYGIILMVKKNGEITKVKEIEAKVISVSPDAVKMKALEDLVMAPAQGCNKVMMKKGETWEEKEGDLFKTREEAIKHIETKYPDQQYYVQ